MAADDGRVLIGEIVAAHGVRGLMKVRTYTQTPEGIADYGALFDQAGHELALQVRRPAKGGVLVAIAGIDDRNRAETMVGTRLYVDRTALQPVDDAEAYYEIDLIGLAVRLADGSEVGRIRSVENYGAGDMLEIEIAENRRTVLIPFTREYVPTVDVDAGYVEITPVPGLLD